jgi:hypothetical protein
VFFETLDFMGFNGHLGLDIGGDESKVGDLDKAYMESAEFILQNWKKLKDKE